MIDAKRFATAYNAFWQYAAPTCDLFVRRANLDGYERWDAPLMGAAKSTRQALSAEYAFSQFIIEHEIAAGIIPPIHTDDKHARAWREATVRLTPYADQGLDIVTTFSDDEKNESKELSRRLLRFFINRQVPLRTRPLFPGCGYIGMSEGDLLSGSTLFEAKSVDRMIRGIDLRQLLTYAALNKSGRIFELDKIGIINPRRGISVEFELDEVCIGISGKPADALLYEIIETVSSGAMSR